MGSEAHAIDPEAGPNFRRRDPRVLAAVALGGALGAPAPDQSNRARNRMRLKG